ncbi:MAG: polysaccharide deacetylase family protein [Gammaproteobacteria bacterium]|nr:polysaccharide deacetylase family protein [Gammaproteobacteria bacterium]
MKLPDYFYRKVVENNNNLFVMGLITFSFPKKFVRSIYERNSNRNLWNGKKACFTLSFDCDYPEDVLAMPSIVEMMNCYNYKASFAAVGHWVEKYPEEHLKVIEAGHELLNHTYSHPDNELLNPGRKFRDISRQEKMEEVIRCHEICDKTLGYLPVGLRIPHFKNLFTDEIYSILDEVNYIYSSSTWLTNTLTSGLPFKASNGIIEFPLSTCPKHPFTVFDTWHSLNAGRLSHRLLHRGAESYLELFKQLIQYGKDTGSYINIYIDPLDVPKIPGFEQMLELLSDPELEVVTYKEYIEKSMHLEPV